MRSVRCRMEQRLARAPRPERRHCAVAVQLAARARFPASILVVSRRPRRPARQQRGRLREVRVEQFVHFVPRSQVAGEQRPTQTSDTAPSSAAEQPAPDEATAFGHEILRHEIADTAHRRDQPRVRACAVGGGRAPRRRSTSTSSPQPYTRSASCSLESTRPATSTSSCSSENSRAERSTARPRKR